MTRIVDGHVHLWPPRKPADRVAEWPGFPEPPDLDARAEALVQQMDAHGVSRAIVVQTPWRHHDDRYLLEQMERHAGRITGVGSFPLMLEEADIAHEAARFGRNGLEGVRLHVTGPNSLSIFESDAIDPLYRRAAETGLPVLLLSRNFRGLETYGRVAARFPGLRLVVEHMGHVTPPFEGTPADEDALMRLSAHPNIFIKIGLHHQHSRAAYPWTDLHPLQRRFLSEFGPQRLFWGSNWPMRLPEPSYTERLETVSRFFPFANEDERAWVLGRTAETLWPDRLAASKAAQ